MDLVKGMAAPRGKTPRRCAIRSLKVGSLQRCSSMRERRSESRRTPDHPKPSNSGASAIGGATRRLAGSGTGPGGARIIGQQALQRRGPR
jgi:hypothetical protein